MQDFAQPQAGLSKPLFSILCHSLGRTERGELKEGHSEDYRNHFVTGPNSTDYPLCSQLVEQGLMVCRESNLLSTEQRVFHVTEQGKAAIAQFSKTLPALPKLSTGQQRYRRYLKYRDMFESFRDFLKWDAEKDHSWNIR